jgi:hypothetical protein
MPTATEPPIGAEAIRITWSDNSANEDGFVLSDNLTNVTLSRGSTSYLWGGLSAGTYKCFHLHALNSAGRSAWTEWACTTTPGPTPGPVTETTLVAADAESGVRQPQSVTSGSRVSISVSRSWCTGGTKQDGTQSCGGAQGVRPAEPGEDGVLVPSALLGALIGRWDTGPWFVIGAGSTLTVPSGAPSLFLACNDRAGFYSDNSGSVVVTLIRDPA